MELITKNIDEMIEELQSIGIDVRPVPMAFVPQDMGNPMRNDTVAQIMSIEDAYRKFACSPMRNYDPFTNKFYNKNE